MPADGGDMLKPPKLPPVDSLFIALLFTPIRSEWSVYSICNDKSKCLISHDSRLSQAIQPNTYQYIRTPTANGLFFWSENGVIYKEENLHIDPIYKTKLCLFICNHRVCKHKS